MGKITEEKLIACPMVGPEGITPMIPLSECMNCKNNANHLVLSRAQANGDFTDVKHIFCNVPVKRHVTYLVKGAI